MDDLFLLFFVAIFGGFLVGLSAGYAVGHRHGISAALKTLRKDKS